MRDCMSATVTAAGILDYDGVFLKPPAYLIFNGRDFRYAVYELKEVKK